MSYGYSVRWAELNAHADDELLGVKLGRVCIHNDVPVAVVASRLRVSRQTVYNWFSGAYSPKPASVKAITALITSLSCPR
jgi:hypothetical protein